MRMSASNKHGCIPMMPTCIFILHRYETRSNGHQFLLPSVYAEHIYRISITLLMPSIVRLWDLMLHTLFLLVLQKSIWEQLSHPLHSTNIRQLLFDFLQAQNELLEITNSHKKRSVQKLNYKFPKKISQPSIKSQVVTDPTDIIDPYILALSKNSTIPYISR